MIPQNTTRNFSYLVLVAALASAPALLRASLLGAAPGVLAVFDVARLVRRELERREPRREARSRSSASASIEQGQDQTRVPTHRRGVRGTDAFEAAFEARAVVRRGVAPGIDRVRFGRHDMVPRAVHDRRRTVRQDVKVHRRGQRGRALGLLSSGCLLYTSPSPRDDT